MKHKRIILTGSAGFICSRLINYLSKTYPKDEFIGIDRKHNNVEIHNENVIIHKLDINKELPDYSGVDTVIHLAALPSVRDSEKRAEDVILDNILATQNIINKCIEDWKPKKLIITSSSSVYDGSTEHEMYEDEKLKPLSPYASSKLACEQMVKMYVDNGRLKGIQPIVIRPFTVAGVGQRDELSIRAIIDSCLNDKVFTLYGNGLQKRDFCNIDDTCKAIEALMNCPSLKHTTYNIGTGKNISINEVIQKVCTMIGKPITINYQPATIYDTMYTIANIDRIKQDTGWESKVSFDMSLQKQIEWQKNELSKEKK